MLSDHGLVWGLTADALPALAPSGTLTLSAHRQDGDTVGDAYYPPDLSAITWPLSVGTPVYAQVGSAHTGMTYGGVLEDHEVDGGVYNNISSTVSTP